MSKKFAGRKRATTKEGKKEEEKWSRWIQVYCNQVCKSLSVLIGIWVWLQVYKWLLCICTQVPYSIMLTLQRTVAHAFKIVILVSCLFNIKKICHISSTGKWNNNYCTFLFPVMKRRKRMRVTERQKTQP